MFTDFHIVRIFLVNTNSFYIFEVSTVSRKLNSIIQLEIVILT